MANLNIDYKTQIVIKTSNGGTTLLSFGTAAAKRAYVRVLKSKEAVEVKVPLPVDPSLEPEVQALEEPQVAWELPEESIQALKDIGWLRDKPPAKSQEEDEQVVELPLPIGLNPLGFAPSAVLFANKSGDLMKCSMPTIMQAILGYLAFETNPGDVETSLVSIKKLTAADAGKEFRFGKWQGKNLIGAIEQAYRYVFETDEELVQELLETGKDILQYQTTGDHEDILLGVAKSGNQWKGKNLIGHVLMALRGELGGEPDPRVELIRGYREYSIEEVSPGGEHFAPHREVVAEMQASIIYGDKPNEKDADEVEAYTQGVTSLKNFILENEWWPLPLFDEVVLIEDVANPASLVSPEPLLEWFMKLNDIGFLQFIGAERSSYGEDLIVPVSEMDLGKVIPTRPYDSHADALKVHIHTSRGCEWWAWYLSEQSAKLGASQLVKLFSILAKNRMSAVEWTLGNHEIHFMSGNEVYTWNFMFRSVEARQTRKAFKNVILNDKPVSSNFVLLWLALRALGGFKGLNGTLNELSNLWEREANYGHAWEADHPTRRVRDNSWAPLTMGQDFMESFGIRVGNGKFNNDLFLKLISTPACRHDAYVDKNGMKVLAGNGAGAASLTSISYPQIALEAFDALDAGVNPLLVLAMVLPKDELFTAVVEILSGTSPSLIVMKKFGSFWTLNDGAKMPKFLNRAQQGSSWNEAFCEIILASGIVLTRVPSMMEILLNYLPEWIPATVADEDDLVFQVINGTYNQ